MNLEIFFDESGKHGNPPMIMGGISIPEKVYQIECIQNLNKKLQSERKSYHFTSYNGDRSMERRIIELFTEMSPYLYMCRANILLYTKKDCGNDQFNDMVYSKFPERIFYGLLRDNGQLMNINANIFMEEATEYRDFPERFKMQLNSQALYRGENFKINTCTSVPKFSEIGVEFTDLVLGIIRIILTFENIKDQSGKTSREKRKLVNKLINIPEVYSFFETLKYFEWNRTQSLKEVKFKNYLDAYRVETIVI